MTYNTRILYLIDIFTKLHIIIEIHLGDVKFQWISVQIGHIIETTILRLKDSLLYITTKIGIIIFTRN